MSYARRRLLDQMIKAMIDPQRQEIQRQRRSAIELSKALADLQRGIGPATNQAYQSAAQTQGGLAQGFTGEMRKDAETDASAAAQLLAHLGAPASQQQQVQDVGRGSADQAYFLGGYEPGRSLSREGAAISSAQNQLPATTLGRGQLLARSSDQDLNKLMATVPALRLQANQQLDELEMKQRAMHLNEAIADRQGVKLKFDMNAKAESLRQGRARIKLTALQNDRQWNATLDRLGLQGESLRLRAAELELKRRKSAKQGGFTATQRANLGKRADTMAEEAYYGVPDTLRADGTVAHEGKDEITYQEALERMIAAGVPVPIAQRALNAYYNEGEGGRPYSKKNQRKMRGTNRKTRTQ